MPSVMVHRYLDADGGWSRRAAKPNQRAERAVRGTAHGGVVEQAF